MKTLIVKIQEKDENFFTKLFNKFHAKHRVISEEEKEEHAIAKWIDEGMESEEIPKEKIYKYMRKHGVKC